MSPSRFVAGVFSIALMALASVVSGQTYPNKPIRIFNPTVGGSVDFAARIIAPGISGPLGQPVIVENRATPVDIEIVAKAPPDGYTLLLNAGTIWFEPLFRKTSYDSERDFLPIAIVTSAPQILVVHPSLPVKTVKQLIALAKAKPGVLNYASSSIGGANHLGGELLNALAGVDIVPVRYKGTSEGVTALLGGEVHMMVPTGSAVAQHLKSGKLRALAVTSARPSALFPGLPTVAMTLSDFVLLPVTGMFAPAGTPAAIINRLNQEVVRALNQTDVKEKFFNAGLEVVASSPAELSAVMKSDIAIVRKIIKDTGIKAN